MIVKFIVNVYYKLQGKHAMKDENHKKMLNCKQKIQKRKQRQVQQIENSKIHGTYQSNSINNYLRHEWY